MSRDHARLRRAAPFAAFAAVAAIASALSFGASAAVADDGDGIGLEVTVSGSPSPSASTPGRGSGGSSTTDEVVTTIPSPSPTLAPDEVDVGGILFLGGLNSDYGWSVNPFSGELVTTFTVRNVSDTVIDADVRFSADGPFGNELSSATVAVEALKPHESREISAILTGIGQWTFIQTHATLTPPKVVDGVALKPVTRTQFLIVPPWLVLGGGALGLGATALFRGLRAGRLVAPPVPSAVGASA